MARTPDGAANRRSRRRRQQRRRVALGVGALVLAVAVVAVVTAVTRGGGDTDSVVTGPAPTTPVSAPPTTTTTLVASPEVIAPPASAEATTATLTRVERALRGDDRDPARLRVLGWEQQLAYRQLSNHADWVPGVLATLPVDVRPWVQGNLDASAALSRLTPPQTSLPDWTILTPPSPDAMRGYYAEAERDSGIAWAYLAAIHFLETRMGRIRGNSTAGAQGPMQFIPSTWQAYGNGGDVNDNRDAILAAGRYLKAAGGPADMDKAIFAYNHDSGYVTAVKAYAQNLLDDPRAYDGYYQWQVYYRTVDGTVLLPEGYTTGGPIGPRALPPA
ncbi:MAG: lytic transglycosylase domain-containing protein [Acidimicrobiia bacterium]|jgi:hypothetical protein